MSEATREVLARFRKAHQTAEIADALDSSVVDTITDILDEDVVVEEPSPLVTLAEDEIDPRLKQLSYSSLLTLHKCPRKYELYKLHALVNPDEEYNSTRSITFAYGHVVGEGMQNILAGYSWEEVVWKAFLMWDCDLLAEDVKAKKGFFLALAAIKRFYQFRDATELAEYDIMYYEGKPAVELGCVIEMPDGYKYRLWIDAVLEHKHTGAIMVFEAKTTKYKNIDPAQFKNSAQAVGYSVVLDHVRPGLSSYDVFYSVYSSTSMEYTPLIFSKSFLQRAHWLRNLLLDKNLVEIYSYPKGSHFPTHGESCFDFFHPCSYFGLCTMSTEKLGKPLTQKVLERIDIDNAKYHFTVSFEELIEAQLSREE